MGPPPCRRLYFGNLPPDVRKSDIEDLLKGYGTIVDITILRNFGFVEMDSLRDAEDIQAEFDRRDFMGDRLNVQFAKAPRENRDRGAPKTSKITNGYRLRLTGLGSGVTWQDLKDFARTVGPPTYADVDRNDPSQGIIEYADVRDAEEALRKLDDQDIKGYPVRVMEEPGRGPTTHRNPPRRRSPSPYGGRRRRYSRSPPPRRRRSPSPGGYSSRRRSPSPGRYRGSRDDRRGGDRDRKDRDRPRRGRDDSRSRSPSRSPPPRRRSPLPEDDNDNDWQKDNGDAPPPAPPVPENGDAPDDSHGDW